MGESFGCVRCKRGDAGLFGPPVGVDGIRGDCGREADNSPGLSVRVGVLPLVGDC